jgi:hypothetical protein
MSFYLGVGDGWVDPYIQYYSYGEYLYSQNLIERTTYEVANVSFDLCKGMT